MLGDASMEVPNSVVCELDHAAHMYSHGSHMHHNNYMEEESTCMCIIALLR